MTAKHKSPMLQAIEEFMSIWDELHADCPDSGKCLVDDFLQDTGVRLPLEEKDADNE